MDFHEAANIFPLDEEHLDELATDIKANGLKVPIQICDGKILDGRRRHLACAKAGVKPSFEKVKTDDPVAYALSLNLHRRHLTKSQAGVAAAKARDWYDKQAKKRQHEGGKAGRSKQLGGKDNCPYPRNTGQSRDQAGEAFGVSGQTVDRATKLLQRATPEVVSAVETGKISLNRASLIAEHPAEMQKQMLQSNMTPSVSPRAKPAKREIEPEEGTTPGTPKRNGKLPVGVILANEALNVLMRIPKNDPLRKRGFQIVTDWIRANK